MNKKIQDLADGLVVSTEVFRLGRFTAVVLRDNKKRTAVGLARRSDLDRINEKLALEIATGRAKRALYLKTNRKKIQNILMG